MKMLSDCSGPCETCANYYIEACCMAGHGDDHYVPVSPATEAKRLADRLDFDPPANPDTCVICQGRNGGVPGNENMIDGEPVCDYCTAQTKEREA